MPLTDFPNRFDDLKQVYVGDQLLDIDSIKYHKQFVILHFKQYPVREEAMRLTGQLVSLDRSQAAPLAEGSITPLISLDCLYMIWMAGCWAR